MPDYDLAEVARQRTRLPDDVAPVLADCLDQWAAVRFQRTLQRVLVVGNGDSLAAAEGCALALREAAIHTVTATPTATLAAQPDHTAYDLVVVISASGRNPNCTELARRLTAAGTPVAAITGDPNSPLAGAARHVIAWSLTGLEPAPGIRTYQANVLALLALAAVRSGQAPDPSVLVRVIEGSGPAHADLVAELADRVVVGWTAPVIAALGAHVGSARYAAAKQVETAGLLAHPHDLEEWWHVARFAQPGETPVLVLDPPALLATDAAELADKVEARGHPVFRANRAGLHEVPEAWWPLWHQGLAVDLAHTLAERRGVRPFAGPVAGSMTGPVAGSSAGS